MKKYNIKNNKIIVLIVILVILAIIGIIAIVNRNNKLKTTSNDIFEEANSENREEEPLIIAKEEIQETVDEKKIEEPEAIEEKEEKEEKNQKKEQQIIENKAKYYIKVNYQANVVTIYTKDKNGNYTLPIKAMVCSTGKATPTSGTYSISNKYRWRNLVGGVSGQYCTRIVNSILFHSVPYVTYGDNSSLEYWEFDKLGVTASAGCVRLTVEDAKWIYDNCSQGTKVEFYADANPGPLGKPTVSKISNNVELRNWDPTDENPNNPWKSYSPQIIQENTEEKKSEQLEKNEDKVTQEVIKKDDTADIIIEKEVIENNTEEKEDNTKENGNIEVEKNIDKKQNLDETTYKN